MSQQHNRIAKGTQHIRSGGEITPVCRLPVEGGEELDVTGRGEETGVVADNGCQAGGQQLPLVRLPAVEGHALRILSQPHQAIPANKR